MLPVVSRWGQVLLAVIGLLASLLGCAGETTRISLQVPAAAPLAGPPGSPRLAIRLLRDLRDHEAMKAREGWFLEYLPDDAVEAGIVQSVTDAIVQHARSSGLFQQVIPPLQDEFGGHPSSQQSDLPPADLTLEGDLLSFYAERSTLTHPFFSMMAAPLSFPLAALTGLKLIPTPLTPILPVDYRANVMIRVRLRDVQTGAVLWEQTVEGTGEYSEAAAVDFFRGKETLMREVASSALQNGIEKLARRFPPAEWFSLRWPKRRTPLNTGQPGN